MMNKILIVDDIEENLLLLEEILTHHNYSVFKAGNGIEALKILQKEPIDLVISDISMIGMSGYELCKKIKADKLTKNISVVLITAAKKELNDMVFGLDVGADEYLIKPVETAVLIARVRAMLRLKGLNDKLVETERLEAISQIAVTANHEINGPLTGIIGNIEFLQMTDNGFTREEKQEKLEVIKKQAFKISEVVKRLSKITKSVKTSYAKDIEMIDIYKQ